MQPYNFDDVGVQNAFGGPNATIANPNAGNPNAFQWDKIMALNDVYKTQYGANITPDALMRNYNEASGNYLWGPPAGMTVADVQAAHPGATVADPTSSIATPEGVYKGGTYTPNVVDTQHPVVTNPVVNAPSISNLASFPAATSPNAFRDALAATTNTINQPGQTYNIQPATGSTGGVGSLFGSPSTGTGAPQGSASDKALKQLQDYIAGQQNPLDILTGRQTALGVPQAQQQVSGLRQAITNTTNLLNQIAPSVQGRTANSLVTSAQAGRMIANEQAPVQADLGRLGQQAGDAQSGLDNLLKQAQGEAGVAIEGQQQNVGNLQQIYQNIFGQQQFSESMRQFNVKQASDREQFEKNLALDVKRLCLSEQQVDLARKEFEHKQYWEGVNHADALQEQQWQHNLDVFQQSMQQQELAEQARQANLANAPSSGGGGGGGSTGGGSSGGSQPASIATVINFFKNEPASSLKQMYNITDPVFGEYNSNGTNYYRWGAAEQELRDAGYNPDDPAIKAQLKKAFGGP